MAQLIVRELREKKQRKKYGNALVFEIICNFEKPALNRKRFGAIIVACLQALYFLFKVRRTRVLKNKTYWGFFDCQRKGAGVGEEELALADVLEKNEKKNKSTSVYRLRSLRLFSFCYKYRKL